jgi:6-phosphofructokinase
MTSHIRRIAVCTGGGDAPGLNAVIRSVAIAAANRGWECYGIHDGFNGICFRSAIPMVACIASPAKRCAASGIWAAPSSAPPTRAIRCISR